MHQGDVFILKTPTLGISSANDSERVVVSIPANAKLTILDLEVGENRSVDVEWRGMMLTIFVADLRERAVKLHTGSSFELAKRVLKVTRSQSAPRRWPKNSD